MWSGIGLGGLIALFVVIGVADSCTTERVQFIVPTPNLAPSTPDIAATVTAAVEAALPTANPIPTPDIEATVEAYVQATIVAIPSPPPTFTPIPTATVIPAPTPIPSPNLVQMVERVRPGVVRIQTQQSVGSGVIFEIISDDGALLLTNYHVIEGATRVDVTVDDSKTYKGVVLGVDPLRDLAVVKICCGLFEALPLGQASRLKAGSEVVAMGYALGYSGSATVTRGIVSAFRYDSDNQRSVIQMDAPINPGNSGGPLFNLSGEIVGINTFKQEYTTSGRPTEGLGFAVSEVTVRSILPDLKTGKRFVSPTPTLRPASTLRPTPRGKWETYDNTEYNYRLEVPPGWTVNDSSQYAVEILSPEPDLARLVIYYMGTTNLSVEGYANKVLKDRETVEDGSFKPLSRSSGGYTRYGTAQIDFEVSYGPGFCDALVSDLIAIVKDDRRVYHLIGVRYCPNGIEQYESPMDRLLDSFFIYR